MAGERFYTDEENTAELLSHMADDDRHRYLKFGHNQVEACFADRVFIIYRPEGLMSNKKHAKPSVLTTVRVVGFECNQREGASAIVENSADRAQQAISYVPKKIFGYPIYVSMPSKLSLRWDAREIGPERRVWRTLSFAILVKSKNKPDFYSKGNTYMVTPNKMRDLFPEVTGDGGKFVF